MQTKSQKIYHQFGHKLWLTDDKFSWLWLNGWSQTQAGRALPAIWQNNVLRYGMGPAADQAKQRDTETAIYLPRGIVHLPIDVIANSPLPLLVREFVA